MVTQRLLLVVHGDSGCGKSSPIYAGVLPRLEQEAARGGTRWLTAAATPGEQPLWNLALALSSLSGASKPLDPVACGASSTSAPVASRRLASSFGGARTSTSVS